MHRTYDEPGNRYPEWMAAWNEKAAEIDEQLIDFYQNTKQQTAESFDIISDRIRDWFERQQLEPEARAQWIKVKADAKLFKAQVENRVTHLVQNGRIKMARKLRAMRNN